MNFDSKYNQTIIEDIILFHNRILGDLASSHSGSRADKEYTQWTRVGLYQPEKFQG